MKELKKSELVELAKEAGLSTKGKTKAKLIAELESVEPKKVYTEVIPVEVDPVEVLEAVVEALVPEDDGLEEVVFKNNFVGHIGGKWYKVPKGIPVRLAKDVVGRFRAAGKIE